VIAALQDIIKELREAKEWTLDSELGIGDSGFGDS